MRGPHLHQVVYSGKELSVGRETAVELVPWFGHQTLGKLALEHQHGTPDSERAQHT